MAIFKAPLKTSKTNVKTCKIKHKAAKIFSVVFSSLLLNHNLYRCDSCTVSQEGTHFSVLLILGTYKNYFNESAFKEDENSSRNVLTSSRAR